MTGKNGSPVPERAEKAEAERDRYRQKLLDLGVDPDE